MVDGLKFGRSKTGLNARFSKDTPLHDVRYAVLDTELTSRMATIMLPSYSPPEAVE